MNQPITKTPQLPKKLIWLLDRLICSWLIVAALIGSFTLYQWYLEATNNPYQTIADANFENLTKEQLQAIDLRVLQAIDNLKTKAK